METLDRLSSGTDEQRGLEQEALTAGIAKYRERTSKHASKETECHTDYGQKLVALSIKPFEQKIRESLNPNKPGRHQGAIRLLKLVDPNVAARIAARGILDGISSTRPMQGVALRIGKQIQDYLRFTKFKAEKPGLYHKVKRNFDESPRSHDDERRQKVMNHAANKFNVAKVNWSHRERLRLGSKLIELFIESVGDVEPVQSTSRKDGKFYLRATRKLREEIQNHKVRCEALCPQFMPMVCPPRPWTTLTDGGYLTRPLKRKLGKGSIAGLHGREMPKVYEAVNTLQATPWKVNVPLWSVVKSLWEAGLEVKGFPPRGNYPVPPKPPDYATNPKAKSRYNADSRSVWALNLKFDGQRMQTAKIRHLAEKFSSYPAIWFPMQLDFRGRLYPIPQFLNPQGCDLARGLLTFAEGKPLGREGVRWLAIHLANTFGYDKCSLQERHDWAVANSEKIEASATNPLGCRWWMDTDKPFQFLAACIEWLGFKKEGENYVSSLPIMVDGSCNGLQHLSAMLRDEECGAKVNLVPGDKPADIYQTVADAVTEALRQETGESVFQGSAAATTERAKAKADARQKIILDIIAKRTDIGVAELKGVLCRDHKINVSISTLCCDLQTLKLPSYVEQHSKMRLEFAQKWLTYGITRKLCKGPVMILPYGGARQSFMNKIQEHVEERQREGHPHPFGNDLSTAINELTTLLTKAMNEVVVGPKEVMRWLKTVANRISNSNEPLKWTTPIGFYVQKKYVLWASDRVPIVFAGKKMKLSVAMKTDELDKKKQNRGAAPNFVHSLDASALMFTICDARAKGLHVFAAVHDAYGTLAADMPCLLDCLREAFVRMYDNNDVLEQFRVEVGAAKREVQLPPIPGKGKLDIRGVLKSDFFFA